MGVRFRIGFAWGFRVHRGFLVKRFGMRSAGVPSADIKTSS